MSKIQQRMQSDLHIDSSTLSQNLDMYAPHSTLTKVSGANPSFSEKQPPKEVSELEESEISHNTKEDEIIEPQKENDIAEKNAKARASRTKFCVPLGLVLLIQAVTVIALLAVITWEFQTGTEDLTTQSIRSQIHTLRIGLEKVIMSPLAEGEAAARAMIGSFRSDPLVYRVTNSTSLQDDFRSSQVAEGLIRDVSPIFLIAQFREYPYNGTISLASILIYDKIGILKSVNDQSYYGTRYALSVSTKEAFGNQSLVPVSVGVNALAGTLLGYNASGFVWTVSDWRSDFNDPSTALLAYTLAFPINKIPNGIAGRNSWFGFLSVNPINSTNVLRDIIGSVDQTAALYDMKTSTRPLLVSSTIRGFRSIDPVTLQPWVATRSPYSTLNLWFSKIRSTCIGSDTCDDVVIKEGEVFLGMGRIRLNREGRPDSGDMEFIFIIGSKENVFFADVHSLRIKMTWQICLAGGILLVVGVFIVTAFGIPIMKMKKNFAFAAELKNDAVVPHGSILLELDWLCKYFDTMNAKLGAARAFMPAWMLLDDSATDDHTDGDNDGDENDDENEMSQTTSEGDLTADYYEQSGRSGHPSITMVTSKSILTKRGTLEKANKSTKAKIEAAIALSKGVQEASNGLVTRRVAVLSMDVRNFVSATTSTRSTGSSSNLNILSGPTTIAGATTALLDLVTSAANMERGIVDSFHGDHFIISFNANRVTGAPGRKAVQCALTISEQLRAKIPKYARVAMGVAVSQASVGVLGNSSQKRFSVVGSCYGKALALSRASKRLEKEAESFLSLAQKEALATAQKHVNRNKPTVDTIKVLSEMPPSPPKGFHLPSVVTEMSINPGGVYDTNPGQPTSPQSPIINKIQAPTSALMPTPARTTAFPIEDDLMFGTPKEGSLVSVHNHIHNSNSNLTGTQTPQQAQRRHNPVPTGLMSRGRVTTGQTTATASINSSNASIVSVTRVGTTGGAQGVTSKPSFSMNPGATASVNIAHGSGVLGAGRTSRCSTGSAPTVVNHQHFTATYLPRATSNMFGCLFTEDIRADLKGIIEVVTLGFYNPSSNGSDLAFTAAQQQLGRDSNGGQAQVTNNSIAGEGTIGRDGSAVSIVGGGSGAQSPKNKGLSVGNFLKSQKAPPMRIFAAISKIIAKSDEAADEWMYELKNRQARSPFEMISKVTEAAMEGDWEAVTKGADDRSATKSTLEESLMLSTGRQLTTVVDFGELSGPDDSTRVEVKGGGGVTNGSNEGLVNTCLAPLFTVLANTKNEVEDRTKSFHPLNGGGLGGAASNPHSPTKREGLLFSHQIMLAPTPLDRAARKNIAQQLLVKINFGDGGAGTSLGAAPEASGAFMESTSYKPSFEEATEWAVGAQSRAMLLTELYCWLRLGKYMYATNGDETALAEALNLAIA